MGHPAPLSSTMQSNKADSAAKPRYDYTVALDAVAMLCILVIASRPDGLAITLCAIIVALAAVVYRVSARIQSRWADRAQKAEELDRTFTPPKREAPVVRPPALGGASKSWLRDSN
jgi:hypothetical protein